jgi:hypothetical protein
MDNSKICKFNKCNNLISKKYIITEKPITKSNIYYKILDSIILSQVFCIKHTKIHTNNICNESNIYTNVIIK